MSRPASPSLPEPARASPWVITPPLERLLQSNFFDGGVLSRHERIRPRRPTRRSKATRCIHGTPGPTGLVPSPDNSRVPCHKSTRPWARCNLRCHAADRFRYRYVSSGPSPRKPPPVRSDHIGRTLSTTQTLQRCPISPPPTCPMITEYACAPGLGRELRRSQPKDPRPVRTGADTSLGACNE